MGFVRVRNLLLTRLFADAGMIIVHLVGLSAALAWIFVRLAGIIAWTVHRIAYLRSSYRPTDPFSGARLLSSVSTTSEEKAFHVPKTVYHPRDMNVIPKR